MRLEWTFENFKYIQKINGLFTRKAPKKGFTAPDILTYVHYKVIFDACHTVSCDGYSMCVLTVPVKCDSPDLIEFDLPVIDIPKQTFKVEYDTETNSVFYTGFTKSVYNPLTINAKFMDFEYCMEQTSKKINQKERYEFNGGDDCFDPEYIFRAGQAFKTAGFSNMVMFSAYDNMTPSVFVGNRDDMILKVYVLPVHSPAIKNMMI